MNASSELTQLNSTSATARPDGYAVILTACIDPSTGNASVHRRDPLVRLADYKAALRFWLDLPDPRIDRIVFLENSGYPLEEIAAEVAHHPAKHKRVELVSMECNQSPPGISYGYSELAMLDQGLPKSVLATSAKYWIKATGRLQFPNVSTLLDGLPADYLLAVDTRDNTRFVKTPQRFVTTQLMIFAQAFYRSHLFDIKQGLTQDCALIENLLFEKLMPLKGQPGVILRWPVNVDPVGQAAHWEKKYRTTRTHAINTFRSVARRVAPGWWV